MILVYMTVLSRAVFLFLDNTIPLIHDVAGLIFLLLAILCCVFHQKVKKDLIKNPLKSE